MSSTNTKSSIKVHGEKKINYLDFQFTRHVASCNNINAGKLAGKDGEPAAAYYGIYNTILFAQKTKLGSKDKEAFNSDNVYVSNLLRTWQTALLLYGTKTNTTNLKLHISPYLKELHNSNIETFKRGNWPDHMKHSANKFLHFLKTLKAFSREETRNLTQSYGSFLVKKETLNFPSPIWYDSLPKKITLTLPSLKINESKSIPQEIVYEKNKDGDYEITNFCKLIDTVGPEAKKLDDGRSSNEKKVFSFEEAFNKTGDLEKFMIWFSNNKKTHKGLVHVVTHSQLMQEYLRNKLDYDIDKMAKKNKKSFEYKTRKSNTWRLKLSLNPQQTKYSVKNTIVPGILLEKEKAISQEMALKAIGDKKQAPYGSLCGKQGSVDDIEDEVCTYHKPSKTKKTGGSQHSKTKKRKQTKKRKEIKKKRKNTRRR